MGVPSWPALTLEQQSDCSRKLRASHMGVVRKPTDFRDFGRAGITGRTDEVKLRVKELKVRERPT